MLPPIGEPMRGAFMGVLEDKLKRMGYTIPPPFKFPNPNRTGCVVVGSIVFVWGHGRDLPSLLNVKHAGKVGRDLTIEEGYATARAVALSMLPSLKRSLAISIASSGLCACLEWSMWRRGLTGCPR